MTWSIRGIVLPMDPQEVIKQTTRVVAPSSAQGNFPDNLLNQPAKFEFKIKGLIWPRQKAQELDEAMKNPDTEEITILTTDEQGVGKPWMSGLYSAGSSKISRKKPIYTRDENTGKDEEVYEFELTFVKFADAGTNQDTVGVGPDGDEDTGFLDMDADGDGKIDLEGVFDFLTSIFTWGASDPPA